MFRAFTEYGRTMANGVPYRSGHVDGIRSSVHPLLKVRSGAVEHAGEVERREAKFGGGTRPAQAGKGRKHSCHHGEGKKYNSGSNLVSTTIKNLILN